MSLPLDNIRVIDLGQVYAAPYCTLQLAAMGADIIKIEPPLTGEVLRRPELPPGGSSGRRSTSPVTGGSILTISAPIAASCRVQYGAA